ncbi:MAG: hypothetical protein LBP56_09670 [Odoribacteraceae bacterium]|jgi:cell division septum initiation protein DivIVA|nr:hypothetical protein [Odoribacteraceae bacterium]
MAAIKQLKKEVDILINNVLADCEACLDRSKDKEAEISELELSVLRFEQEIRSKINGHKKITSPKEKREYFKQLIEELNSTVKGQFTRLSEIVQK